MEALYTFFCLLTGQLTCQHLALEKGRGGKPGKVHWHQALPCSSNGLDGPSHQMIL